MFLKTFIIYREFPTRIAAAAVFSRCVLNQGNPHFNRVIFYLHDENGLVFSKVLRCLTEQYLQIFVECCQDPAVHERITISMRKWIEEHAPGVRRSEGCPKKVKHYEPSLRKILKHLLFETLLYKIYYRLHGWMDLPSPHTILLPFFSRKEALVASEEHMQWVWC